jgi:hypothetical protein
MTPDPSSFPAQRITRIASGTFAWPAPSGSSRAIRTLAKTLSAPPLPRTVLSPEGPRWFLLCLSHRPSPSPAHFFLLYRTASSTSGIKGPEGFSSACQAIMASCTMSIGPVVSSPVRVRTGPFGHGSMIRMSLCLLDISVFSLSLSLFHPFPFQGSHAIAHDH